MGKPILNHLSLSLQNNWMKSFSTMVSTRFKFCLNESVVHSRLKSTNCLERLNEEIRRRERVIRIFPNVESAYRLIEAMLIVQDEEWLTADRIYIQM